MRSRVARWAVGLWPVALVVAVDPWGWYPFGPLRWLVVSVGIPVLFAVTAAAHPLRIVARVQGATLALLAVLAVAATFGLDRLYAWTGTPERHFGVLGWALSALALVVGQSVPADEGGGPAVVGTVVAGLALGVVGTAEALGWEPRVLDVDDRLSATFGSAAYLGAAVALLLPVCVGVALDRTVARRLRAVAAGGCLTLAVTGLGSGARAAWLGLAVAAVVVAGCRWRVLLGRPGIAVAVLGAVAVVAVGIVVLTPVGDRLAAAVDADAPGGQSRTDEWRVAARVIAAHPVVGVGPEGYRIAFAEGVDDDYAQRHGRDPTPDRAHSAPLDLAVIGGVPGLIAWLVLVVLVGRHVLRALRAGPGWRVGLAAALVAHLVGQLLLFPVIELEPLAWLLAGVVVATTATASELRVVAAPRATVMAAGVVAGVALVAGTLDVAADHRARDAVVAQGDGDPATAWARASDAVGLRPDEVRLHLLEAQLALAADRGTTEALGSVDAALALSPGDPIGRRRRAALLVQRAEATLLPADADEARADVDDLVADDPHDPEIWGLVARVARLDGAAAREQHATSEAARLARRTNR